jgi:hypothetical protein
VAVHWPGTTQDRIGGDRAAIISRLQHYHRFHTQDRGWRDIGYNVAIDQAGRVWMLRSTAWKGNLVGAHCASDANRDANEEYVGVLLLLGDREPLSAAMIRAFVDWYRGKFLPGWPGRFDVRMHGQVVGASTACAGPYVKAALPQLKAQSAPQPPQEDDEMDYPQFKGFMSKFVRDIGFAKQAYDKALNAWIVAGGTGTKPAATYDAGTASLLSAIMVWQVIGRHDPADPVVADRVAPNAHRCLGEAHALYKAFQPEGALYKLLQAADDSPEIRAEIQAAFADVDFDFTADDIVDAMADRLDNDGVTTPGQ